MASAFNWSPGGCCCESFPGPWAMGVNDLDNPTGTRIPRRCRITYSGITATPSPPDNTVKQLDIDIASWFNNYVDTLEAFNPLYSFGANGRPGPLVDSYPTSPTVVKYSGAMHFSTAKPEDVLNPAWPGYAGGFSSPLNSGLLPVRPIDAPSSSRNAPFQYLTSTVRESGAVLNYGVQTLFASGYRDYIPMYPLPPGFSGTLATVKEVSLVPGRWFDTAGAITPIDDRMQFIFCGDFPPGGGGDANASRIYMTYGVRYRNHAFSPTRTQPICVIPDTITFRQQHLLQTGATMGNISWPTLQIDVEFYDWFEGPLATQP